MAADFGVADRGSFLSTPSRPSGTWFVNHLMQVVAATASGAALEPRPTERQGRRCSAASQHFTRGGPPHYVRGQYEGLQ